MPQRTVLLALFVTIVAGCATSSPAGRRRHLHDFVQPTGMCKVFIDRLQPAPEDRGANDGRCYALCEGRLPRATVVIPVHCADHAGAVNEP